MIRLFEPTDLAVLHRLIQKTIDICYQRDYPNRAILFFKNYHSKESILLRSQKGELLVVENDDTLVATGSLVENEITGVFVTPQKQGQQLGRLIMQELETRARQQGFSEVNLSISLPSRKFYESLNYKILENLQIDVGGGQLLHYFSGRKRV